MLGWSRLKSMLDRLWRLGEGRRNQTESPTDSALTGGRANTEADWAEIQRRKEEIVRRLHEEETARLDLETERHFEGKRIEHINDERPGYKNAPPSPEESGLSPLPSHNAYDGGVERSRFREEAGLWIMSGKFKYVDNSDNIYAIAYDLNKESLYVQYKHWAPPMPLGSQHGAGPIYEYKNVSIAEARSFYLAKSPGDWLWDNVRVRGTWSGHRKPYRIVAISRGYLPRRAAWGHDGREWFFQRQIWGATGRAVYSQLPTAPAPPMGYDGKPLRGEPNRGYPYRGRPNRGSF